jgi:HEAT repeat protein
MRKLLGSRCILLLLALSPNWASLALAADQKPPLQSPQVELWLEQLGSDDARLFKEAVSNLGKADAAVIPALLEKLEDGDLRSRQGVVMVLERMGPAAAGSLPALRRAINNDPDGRVRGYALLSWTVITLGLKGPYDFDVAPLPNIPPLSQDVKAVLLDALGDRSSFVRFCATFALSRASSDPKVVDVLLKLLNDNDSIVRARAAQSLGHLDADARKVLPALSKLFQDPDRDVKLRACQAFMRLGGASESAVPVLIEVVNPEFTRYERERKNRMGSIEHSSKDKFDFWEYKRDARRIEAITTLRGLRNAAGSAVPTLRGLLADGSPQVRWEAALALNYLHAGSADTVRILADALKKLEFVSTNSGLLAVDSLGDMGANAKAAMPVLSTIAAHGFTDELRSRAKRALEKIKAQSK